MLFNSAEKPAYCNFNILLCLFALAPKPDNIELVARNDDKIRLDHFNSIINEIKGVYARIFSVLQIRNLQNL